jgi:hypothetical protein
MSNTKKNIIAGLLSFTAITSFYVSKETQAQAQLVVPETPPSGIESLQGREILSLLADIKKIHLNGDLFLSPVFLSLRDFSVDLVAEPKGRINPFASLVGEAVSGVSPNNSRGVTFSSVDTSTDKTKKQQNTEASLGVR